MVLAIVYWETPTSPRFLNTSLIMTESSWSISRCAFGLNLDGEAFIQVGQSDGGGQGIVILQVAPVRSPDGPVLVELGAETESQLFAGVELVRGQVVGREDVTEIEVQGRRPNTKVEFMPLGGQIVLVEPEPVRHVDILPQHQTDAAHDKGFVCRLRHGVCALNPRQIELLADWGPGALSDVSGARR